MKQYKTFIFESYSFEQSERQIQLHYNLDDSLTFTETLTLPEDFPIDIQDPAALDRALFALHLIGGISYYKTCLPKEIIIRSGSLTEEQADFWNTVYTKGLGEFFFQNKIDFRDLIHFPVTEEAEAPLVEPTSIDRNTIRALVPIGGGKDSMVTIELLKKACIPMNLLRIGNHPIIDKLAKTADVPLLSVKRQLDDALFDLNEEGALNGHIPITAYLSVLGIVLCEIGSYSDIVFSNECSADEGNEEYLGTVMNHQWSKSAEFEKLFKDYIRTFVTTSSRLQNPLGGMSELTIAKHFATLTQYHQLATSCNKNWKILQKESPKTVWCGNCPKCAFVFILMSAWLSKDGLIAMFGQNLFDSEELMPTFSELLGIEGHKPFECVGTPDEVRAALLLAQKRDDWSDTLLMNLFEQEVRPSIKNPDELIESVLHVEDHPLDEPYASLPLN